MTVAELAALILNVEKEFAVDWVLNDYARCTCGILLYFDPDMTQLHSCEVCNKSFFHAQTAWEFVLAAHKARITLEHGHGSNVPITGSASSANYPPLAHLRIPTSINGLKVNVSCKDIFEKEVFVAYGKDKEMFDNAVAQIGAIGPNTLDCYEKYVNIYNLYTKREDKMIMNKKIRDCFQDPASIIKALIDIYTAAPCDTPNVSV